MTANPYQPPRAVARRAPFLVRFRRATDRAVKEYRAGLTRENISGLALFRAWLTLILFCCVIAITVASWTIQLVLWISRNPGINF